MESHRTHRVALLALATALVVAGCTGPLAGSSTSTLPTAGDGVPTDVERPTTDGEGLATATAVEPTGAETTPNGTTPDGTTPNGTTPNGTTTTADVDSEGGDSEGGDAEDGDAGDAGDAGDDGGLGVGATRSTIAVRDGSLPANATVVYERVERVLDANASAPAAVRVTNASAFYGNATGTRTASVTGHGAFERALGLEQRVNASTLLAPNGVTLGYGTIALYPGASPSAASVEPLLAHEFVHYVQFATGRASWLRGNLSAPRTTDGWFVRRAILEGVAVTAETAYATRYTQHAPTGIERSRRALAALPAGSAFAYRQLPYVAGYEYVTGRYANVSNASRDATASASDATHSGAPASVYVDPPQTSEQVLHGTTDAPVPLTVDVDTDGVEYTGGPADRLGEAYLRVALANALPEADAADAAAGWGEDSLVVLHRNGTTNYAWTLRFDTPTDATIAERALTTLLDARGNRTPASTTDSPRWRLSRTHASLHGAGNRTVVLAVGTPRFLADLELSTDGACDTDGDSTDCDATAGDSTDCDATAGDSTDCDATAGDSTDCDTSAPGSFTVTLTLDGANATTVTTTRYSVDGPTRYSVDGPTRYSVDGPTVKTVAGSRLHLGVATRSLPVTPTLKPPARVRTRMSRDHLQRASELLADAADESTTTDATERLRTQASEFETHATGDTDPDHGRLARHERILADVADTEGGRVQSTIDDALDEIHAYRETIDGV